MEEVKESINESESENYKLDLSNELNAVQNQTLATALIGLIIISLGLAAYFFFTQKPVVHNVAEYADKHESELAPATNTPNILTEGSRTLESEIIIESEKITESEINVTTASERSAKLQSLLGKPVVSSDTDSSDAEYSDAEYSDKNIQESTQPEIAPEPSIPVLTANERRRQRNQIKLFCAKLGEKLGSVSVADCLAYEFVHAGVISNEKTPIAYIDYKQDQNQNDQSVNHQAEKDKPIKVLMFGGIHGDEFSAVSIVFKWLKFLENEYSQAEQKDIHWRVVPVLNPDGLLQPDGQSKRMNANNVDLNRNFPTPDWEQDALRYWKEKTGGNERRYPGPAAASELETQWVLSQLEEFKPDAVISVHAPFGIVDADGPVEPPQKLGPLELKLLGTYPGSMGRYIGVHKNLPMLTVELERAGSMPKKEDIEHIWLDIQDWIAEKVQDRNVANQAEMQSLRRQDSDDNGSTVIDKKGGD